jgi:hypothetical protein
MPVIFSKEGIIETSREELLAAGFRCLNTKTVIEYYTKEGEPTVYHNTQTNLFFKNKVEKQYALKIIVAGGRDFDDEELLFDIMDKILNKREPHEVQIVSGKAKGADRLGEKYAAARGIDVKEFPAQWDVHGVAAGPIRNEEMAEYANACVCFWDGRSKGTNDMIKRAKAHGLRFKEVRY